MVAVCVATGPSAELLPADAQHSDTFASLEDCEHWIVDVARPDPSVIDMFCIKREVSPWGVVK
jgi:hypothetical protein